MKITTAFFGIASVLSLSLLPAHAEPRGGSNADRDFISGASESDGWSCGLTYNSRDRRVEIADLAGTLDAQIVAAYIGYSPLPFATLYVLGGQLLSGFDPDYGTDPTVNDSSRFLYGASLQTDIFSHEIQDPLLMENKIRVNGTMSYVASEVEVFSETLDFEEFTASLTASIVNDVVGNKMFLPESVAVFAGPTYSSSLSDDIDDSMDDEVGLTVGLEVFHTKRVSYYARFDDFARSGYAAGLNVRF